MAISTQHFGWNFIIIIILIHINNRKCTFYLWNELVCTLNIFIANIMKCVILITFKELKTNKSNKKRAQEHQFFTYYAIISNNIENICIVVWVHK